MNSKINQSKIASYSQELSSVLLDSFFANRNKISGEEIMNLSTVNQVNLFALKELFSQWNTESQKLESPYFDYDHPQVVEVIQNFKNTLSRHISVNRADFEPILQKAISGSLLLIFSPYQYYLDELINAKSSDLLSFTESKKFTKVNVSILDELLRRLSDINDFDPGTLLDSVIDSMSSAPEDTEEYLKMFSNYILLESKDIYVEEEATATPEEEVISPIAQEEESPAGLEERPLENETTTEDSPTINDAFTPENHETLADVHSKQKIESLSKGITLNQRFMFVNVLFEGDVAKFNNTVLDLDGLITLEEAKKYLNTHFAHWSKQSYEVEEFQSVLERRYQ